MFIVINYEDDSNNPYNAPYDVKSPAIVQLLINIYFDTYGPNPNNLLPVWVTVIFNIVFVISVVADKSLDNTEN